jgi:hypothetical protein
MMAHHSKATLALVTAALALLPWQAQVGAQPPGAAPPAPQRGPYRPQVDRKADQILRQMSEHLTSLRAFSV